MNEDFMHVRDHIGVITRQWWLIAVFLVLGAGLGVASTSLETPAYKSEAQVLVPTTAESSIGAESVQTQAQIVRSDSVAQKVIDDLGLSSTPRDLLQSVDAAAIEDTNVVVITVTQSSASRAADVANSFADSYLAFVTDEIFRAQTDAEDAAQSQIDDLQTELGDISTQIGTLKASANGASDADVDATDSKLDELRARRTLLRQLISTETAALAESTLDQAPSGQVLQKAVVPRALSLPWLRGVVLGFALGLLLGLAAAYIRDRRDDSIRDEADLLRVAPGAPILGWIPAGRAGQNGQMPPPGGRVADTYQTLAANVKFLFGGAGSSDGTGQRRSPSAVVVVTPATLGAGATTVVANLAVAAAGAGRRVVVVDANFRDRGLSQRFGVQDSPGLSEFVHGTATTFPLPLVDTAVDGLRILPAGATPADPAEVLSSSRLTDLLTALRDEADLVLVDVPPPAPYADTLSLLPAANQVVMVAKHRSHEGHLATAVERLRLAGGSPTALVFTGLPPKLAGEVGQPTAR